MRDKLLGVLLAVAGLLVVSVPLLAHHSAATFDTTKEITLKGTVTGWAWTNPHTFLKFDAKDDTGTVRNWAGESANPIAMTQRGWSRTSFKAGDEITVTLQPARNGEPVGLLLKVVLPNGQTLVTTPPGVPQPAR